MTALAKRPHVIAGVAIITTGTCHIPEVTSPSAASIIAAKKPKAGGSPLTGASRPPDLEAASLSDEQRWLRWAAVS
jgi:hypothetical protein